MTLHELVAENVRSVERAELEFHPQRNLIWGANGSGKSSVLESVFLLGRGRSFRTRNSERLIRYGQERLISFGRFTATPDQTVGVQISRKDGTVAKVNGAFVRSLAELSHAFSVQVIEPGVHKLIEEGSNRRRRWMDWMVFHVEPTFIDTWSRYTRALKQRNAALRSQPDQASVWDLELERSGEQLAAARRSAVQNLQPYWKAAMEALVGIEVDLGYGQGWAQDTTLAEALRNSAARDRAKAITHSGPHRGDVHLRHRGKLAREVLSRGQQKLVSIAMTLAPLRMIQDQLGTAPTLLLDDPEAELDRDHLSRFINEVAQLRCQLISTALHEADLFGAPDRVFHVEQGRVRPV